MLMYLLVFLMALGTAFNVGLYVDTGSPVTAGSAVFCVLITVYTIAMAAAVRIGRDSC